MRHYKVILGPEAMTSVDEVVKRRWTVVFHIDGDYVVVDRILRSRMLVE